MTTKQEQLIKEIHELQFKTQQSSDIEEFSLLINLIIKNVKGLKFLSATETGEFEPNEYELKLIQELKTYEREIIENGLSRLKSTYSEISATILQLVISVTSVGVNEIQKVINNETPSK